MFLGTYYTKFTGKGRLVLPKKFRAELATENSIILSRGFEGCIFGFSKKDWEEMAHLQIQTSVTDEKGRDIRRLFFSAAELVDLDKQNRFVVPDSLLNFAGIKESATIVGAGDHFEVWSDKKWQEELAKLRKT